MIMIKHPILLNFDLPLKTERLVIRPLMPNDGVDLYHAIQETYNDLKEWFAWAEHIPFESQCEEIARRMYSDFILRTDLNFAIFHDNVFIGMCALRFFNWDIPSAFIGYWLKTTYQNQGLMTECIHRLVDFGFNDIGFRRLGIICDDENEKSIKIAERCGFDLECRALGLISKPGSSDLRMGRRYIKIC
jgi:ribosomal-protein-serine acetyltransferase